MQIHVRYHSIIGDMLGTKEETVTLPDGATIADLRAKLAGRSEKRAAILGKTSAFIGGKHALKDAVVSDGDEVVFNYRLSPGLGRPQWYVPLDDVEEDRRWA